MRGHLQLRRCWLLGYQQKSAEIISIESMKSNGLYIIRVIDLNDLYKSERFLTDGIFFHVQECLTKALGQPRMVIETSIYFLLHEFAVLSQF